MRRFRATKRTAVGTLVAGAAVVYGLPAPAAYAAPPTPEALATAHGLATFAVALDLLADTPAFATKLPLTDRSPADVLGFPTLFTRTLGTDMAAFSGDYTDLATAIAGASETGVTYTVPGGITETAGVATFTVHAVVHRQQDVPISYVRPGSPPDDPNPVPAITVHGSDNASGQTGTVPVDLTLTADLPFRMDKNVTAPDSAGTPVIDVPNALSLDPSAATLTLASGSSSESALSFTSRYGFTDVSVTGHAAYALVGHSVFTDPDAAGSVTQDEWANTLLPDWLDFTLDDPSGATPSVDVSLTFDSSLLPSGTHGGTVTYHDGTAPTYVDLRPLDNTASAPTAPTVALTNLEPFTRIGADDALTGLSQFSAALAAAQARIDLDLPLLDKKFSDAFSPADQLQHLVERQGSAAIICGKANTQPPTGADLAGTTWYCQAVTKQDVTNVHWSRADGTTTGITGATTSTTVGTAPTTNITVTNVTGEPDVQVSFDVSSEQEDGTTATETFTAEPRIRSAQELKAALDALDGSTIGIAYDMAAQTLAYDVAVSDDPAAMPATFDVGDALRPRTGLSGLVLQTAGNPVSVDVGETGLHATYGLLLQSDLAVLDSDGLDGQSDRYYAKLGSGHEVSVASVSVSSTGDYDFTGKVGYLGVDATATTFDLTNPASGDALAADLSTDAAHPIAGLNGTTITGGVSLRRLLAMADPVTPTYGVGLDASFDVDANGNLSSLTDGTDQATVDVTWDDFGPTTKPVADGNDAYDTYLKPFDVLPLVEGTAGNTTASTVTLTDNDTDFTTAFGHVIATGAKLGATLQNANTGATCEDVTVTDSHTLTCDTSSVVDNGTPGGQTIAGMSGGRRQSVRTGTAANGTPIFADADGAAVTGPVYDDNKWRAGDTWRVSGDQDALRALLVENLFDISNRVDQATEPGYITPLPMLGVTPKSLTPQFGKLRDVATSIAGRVPLEAQAPAWKKNTAYALNDLVFPTTGGSLLFKATTAGTSSSGTEPTWPTTAGNTVTDGSVTWTAVAGAPVPPPTLQALLTAIDAEMDAISSPVNGVTLSNADVSLDLATLDHTVGATTHSDVPHAQLSVEWDGAATVDAPVQIDLAPMSQLTLHGLGDENGVVGAMDVATTSSAKVRFAVPLSPDVPTGDVLVRADTGVTDLTATLDSDTVDFTGSVGSLAVRLGTGAHLFGVHDPVVGQHTEDAVLSGTLTAYVLTGKADSGSTGTTLTDNDVDFQAKGVQTGAVVTRGSTTCTVTGITQHTLTCDLGSGNSWATNDDYSLTQDGNAKIATAAGLAGQGFNALGAGDVIKQGTAYCVVGASTAKTQTTIACPISSGTWDKNATFTVESGALLTDENRTGDETAADAERGFDTFLAAGAADTKVTNLDQSDANCLVGTITDTTVRCAGGTTLSGNGTWKKDDHYRLDLGDPTKTLVDPGTGFDGMGLVGRTVHNLTDNATCVISSATKDSLTCSVALSGGGTWDSGDYYEVDGPGTAKANLASWSMTGAVDKDAATYATDSNLGTSAVGGLIPQSCSEALGSPVSGDVCALLATQLVDPSAPHGTVTSYSAGTVTTADTTGVTAGATLRNDTDGFNCVVSNVTATTFVCKPPTGEAWANGDAWSVDSGKYLGVLSYYATFGGTSVAGGLGSAFTDAVAGDEPLQFSLLSVAMQLIRGYVQDGLDGTIADEPFPLIGLDRTAGSHVMDALQALEDALAQTDVPAFQEGPNSITGFKADIETYLQGVFDSAGSDLLHVVDEDGVTVTLVCKTTPHSSGSHECADGTDTDENIVDVRVQTTIGGDAANDEHMDQGCTDAKCDDNVAEIHLPRFISGLPGLELDGPNGLDAHVGWTFDLDFGLARDIGPYVGTTDNDPILEVGADVHLPAANACSTTDVPDGAKAGQTAETGAANPGFDKDRCYKATLGLLQGIVYDGKGVSGDNSDGKNADRTGLKLKATMDISGLAGTDADGRISFDSLSSPDRDLPEFKADADGNIDLYFQTGVTTDGNPLGTTLPSLEGTVHIGFTANGALKGSQADATGYTEITYADLQMNAGSFINGFMRPIIDEIYKITRPFKAIADILMAPIPVLKQIAELTGQAIGTLLDLLEQAAARPLALVRSVVGLVSFVADLAEQAASTLVGLGSWNNGVQSKATFSAPKKAVTTGPCGKTDASGNKQPKDCQKTFKKGGVQYKQSVVQLKDCPASGCTGKELARTMTRTKPKLQKFDGFGITFPFLNDTSQVMGLLVGEQATLVRFDPGAFGVSASLHYSWGPFMAGPVPVDISIGGTIGLSAHFALGYDTRGIWNVLQQDRDSFDADALADGIFIDDLDVGGNDVDEIELTFVVTLGAAVSVSIFKVGLYGGVGITIGFDLVDPDNDGKLYIDEIEQFKDNPICLFKVQGLLDFFFGFFVEVDLKFWSNRWEYELFRLKPPIKLFEAQCTRTEPDLAVVVSGNLRLNIGDVSDGAGHTYAQNRHYKSTKTNEKFVVRQLAAVVSGQPTPVEVEFSGLVQQDSVPSGGRILADSGSGNDVIELASGATEAGTEVLFTLPATINAGSGDDQVTTGAGDDQVAGGDGNDKVTTAGGNDRLAGDGNEDSLDGGLGSDVVSGGDGNDRANGNAGSDWVAGDAGDDTLDGGPGLNDTQAATARSRNPNLTVAGANALKDGTDVVVGGAGTDSVSGHLGDDYLFGGSFKGFTGTAANDRERLEAMNGTTPSYGTFSFTSACAASELSGDGGDQVKGESGNDTLVGDAGDDTLSGGVGNDSACGGSGADTVEGDSANSTVFGNDTLRGGTGNDSVLGRGGDDVLDGEAGEDLLDAGDGTDRVTGGAGADAVDAGAGNDIVLGDTGTIPTSAPITTSGSDVKSLVTSDSATDASANTTPIVCRASATVLGAGTVDLDGDGTADSGRFLGHSVVSGVVKTEGGSNYNGTLGDRVVTNGVVQGGAATVSGIAMSVRGRSDCIVSGDGHDAVFAGPGDDWVVGESGRDYVQGDAGADYLRGYQDADEIDGGADADDVYGDTGADLLTGGAGNDTVHGGIDADVAYGGPGDDTVSGEDGNDVLVGGSSTAAQADGADTIDGGAGNDVVAGDNAAPNVAKTDVTLHDLATPASYSGNDTLGGQTGNDVIYGQGGADAIDGNEGNDRLDGNSGADTINGNGGNDTMSGGTEQAGVADDGDTMHGGQGTDTMMGDNGSFGVAVTLYDRPLAGSSAPAAGTSGNDSMWGDEGDDFLYAQGGDDTVRGDTGDTTGTGNDYAEGGPGDDTIWGAGGTDRLIGGSDYATEHDGDDDIHGGDAADVVTGDNAAIAAGNVVTLHDVDDLAAAAPSSSVSGDDTINGDAGADRIYGQGADDDIHGGADADAIEGDSGADHISGDTGDDRIAGGNGVANYRDDEQRADGWNDQINGGDGADAIAGDNATITALGVVTMLDVKTGSATTGHEAGRDLIHGNAQDDTIYAQGGDDEVHGDDGNDYVEGNGDDDDLYGEAGTDRMTGGTSQATAQDGDDLLVGGDADDVLTGDNATIGAGGTVVLLDVKYSGDTVGAEAGDDEMYGDAGTDVVYGQSGDDDLHGGAGDDYVEGNAGADTIAGGAGADRITGGSGIDNGGPSGAVRELRNTLDTGDVIHGNEDADIATGDNARITAAGVVTRYDEDVSGVAAPPADVSGDDEMYGDAGTDRLYGQSGNDTMSGGSDDDVMEGDTGADTMTGDAGDDNMVGGSTHDATLRDGAVVIGGTPTGDTMSGNAGVDVMLGDNGVISGSGASAKWTFYDLDPSGAGPHPDADRSGPDTMNGNDGTDWMFGQGGDDTMSGGADDDRMQGNAGADTIEGDEGADDIVGGSAWHFVGTTLTPLPAQVDGGDTISGDDPTGSHGAADRSDAIVGDNGRVDRTGSTDPNTGDAARTMRLFDVQVAGAAALPANGYGNDTIGGNDGTDYVFGGGGDDTLHGHAGDDRVEGNAGADTITGDSGDDDVVGGSSSKSDGNVRFTAPAVTAADTVTNLADGGDTIDGGTGEDAVLADNGVVARTLNSGLWTYHAAPFGEIPKRVVQAPISHEVAGAYGNDTVDGGLGHDELYGELGNDTVSGNGGDDAIMGDLGRVTPSVNGTGAGQNGKAQQVIQDSGRFVVETVYATGSLQRDATLYDLAVGGNDTLDGGRGNDSLRGGAGNDTLYGNGGATDLDADLTNVCPTTIALTCDRDAIFGDDGDDWMWGGPDKDHMYGGYGSDHLDVVRPGTLNPQAKFKGPDVMYGGWDQDAMQADISAPSPNGDDKMADASGVYNIYYVCEGAYGGHSIVRTLSPSLISTLQAQATADGAFNVTTKGSSGFDEMSMIFSNDIKLNNNPPYLDSPGHFICA